VVTDTLSALPPRPSLHRFALLLALVGAVMIPAVILRIEGWRPNPLLDTFVFGAAILAAGFFLSWGAEAAEKRISAGLIVAIVALITVLPEYAVDFYYAYLAGANPGSNYVHYAAANMTGANRLLVGLAWPLLVLLHWRRTRETAIVLRPANRTEILFLLLPSLYAFAIVAKGRISAIDTVVLIAMFGLYMWRASRKEAGADNDDDDDEEPGPAAALMLLSPLRQWLAMGALTIVAAVIILVSAEPFAESMIDSGRLLGFDEFLLIQWLAPLASEAPAVVVAALFVVAGRAESGLATMISDKINQWTLLVSMLPLAVGLGAGHLTSLPLDARQHEEFFLTAAQSLFGIGLLLRLRLSLGGAAALAILFSAQVALAVIWQDDEPRIITSLTWLGWGYLALTSMLFATNRHGLAQLVSRARPGCEKTA
jgi:cation:H+ antiporter